MSKSVVIMGYVILALYLGGMLLIAAAAAGYTGMLISQFAADVISALLALGILWKCFPQKAEA